MLGFLTVGRLAVKIPELFKCHLYLLLMLGATAPKPNFIKV